MYSVYSRGIGGMYNINNIIKLKNNRNDGDNQDTRKNENKGTKINTNKERPKKEEGRIK